MWKTRILVIGLIGVGVALWFFFPTSDETKVLKALRGYHEALAAGDMKKMESFFTAVPGQELAALGVQATPTSKPDRFKIEKVAVNQDKATVKQSAMMDGDPFTETVDFTKEQGAWKISHVTWTFEFDDKPATARTSKPQETTQGDPIALPAQTASGGADPAPAVVSSYQSGVEQEYTKKFRGKSIPELQSALATEDFQNRYLILDDLIKRGARQQAAATLNEMLRDRSGGPRRDAYWSWSANVRSLLKKIDEPLTFAYEENNRTEKGNDKLHCQESEIELRDDSLFSSGSFFVGPEIIEGLSRPITVANKIPTFSPRYVFEVEGGSLHEPIEKTIPAENRSGDQRWNQVLLASGLGPGTYRVSLRIEVLTVTPDGVPKQYSCQGTSLEVEKR